MPVTNIYAIGAFAALGGILFGFDVGSNSGIIGMAQYKDYFDHPSSTLQGGINGSLSAGCFVGALVSGYFAERFGRRNSIAFSALLFILGSAITASAQDVPMLIVGRIFNGLCVGLSSMLVPLYQAEIAPKDIRGRLVSVQQWAITWGIFISFWIQYGTSYLSGSVAWRLPYGLQVIPAVILFVGMFFFPYSPRWLANKGRKEEALNTLALLHGNGDINHPTVQAEFEAINEAIRYDQEVAKSTAWKDLFTGTVGHRVFLGVSLQMWQQLTGMNIIMFYVVYLAEQAGIQDQSANLLASGISFIVNVIFTIPAILFVDRWGRRATLIAGSAGMTVCMVIVGSILAGVGDVVPKDPSNPDNGLKSIDMHGNTAATYSIIAMVYIFVACFATTWGPVGWIYPVEIFPQRVRAKATSLSTASNWLFNYLLSQFVPMAMDHITFGLYFLFAGFNLLMTIHVWWQFPETKGKTLEDMEACKAGNLVAMGDAVERWGR
ncbi:high affinity glucose transporter [Basidiobolus meristosporus CBS 931.73]|uniref:High affinity glucose transporter n=1 Tax=Basidiobolus meristosporus CBS 931.73 TaxID=1314790 RepID=A0A1Y1Z9M0_9FUNG|nr:high affinity glucose transporter [Basidiobolus meristosporus CBS 931.73]|eukprot:ORY06727.1 high affinity glucose transporter [Basidiobolus meristosporus CBS 931.73]